jgi:hypothetical protein
MLAILSCCVREMACFVDGERCDLPCMDVSGMRSRRRWTRTRLRFVLLLGLELARARDYYRTLEMA